MQEIDMTINKLPARTWRWLGMNEAKTEQLLPAVDGSCQPDVTIAGDGVKLEHLNEGTLGYLETGAGSEMEKLAGDNRQALHLKASAAGDNGVQQAVITYNYTDGKRCYDRLEIYAEAGSRLTVLMSAASAVDAAGLAAVETRIYAGAGAQVKLVQVQLLGSGFTHFNDIGCQADDDAAVEVLQLELGGSTVYSGALANLTGSASSFKVETGYYGRGKQHLDMNYVALHRGKKSQSYLGAEGVMKDEARKLYRATIDFKTGSSGSVGEEVEGVLLLSDDAINQTIPLILCSEEDVQGNHGASIGRLDENLLFYLMSRGFSKDEAVNMMARAKIDALCRKIDDENIVQQVQDYVEKVVQHAE